MKKQEKNNLNDNMPKDNPFIVPGDYFGNLAGKIEERIKEKTGEEKKILRFWSSARNQLALAAGFVLFVLISYSVMHFIIGGNNGEKISGLQYADVIESEIQNYDTDLLINAYIESSKVNKVITDEGPDEEMIEYLISEDVEIEMIIDEF